MPTYRSKNCSDVPHLIFIARTLHLVGKTHILSEERMDSNGPQSPHVSSSTHSTSPLLKKSSPLKHVTPIIKKYDCQRQAKNGKSSKLKPQGKILEEVIHIE